MNAFRTTFLAAAAAAFTFGAVPVLANSDPARTIVVKYDELDLASAKGAVTLYTRLRYAARQVCAPLEGRGALKLRAAYRECYNDALANAVRQVDVAAVTALHARAVQGERAS